MARGADTSDDHLVQPADPMELGARIINVLETGSRESTFKIATLMALSQHCVEFAAEDRGSGLPVRLHDLAVRVIGLYWRQQEPFEGSAPLRQSKGEGELLPAIRLLRDEALRRGVHTPMRMRHTPAYQKTIRTVARVLAQLPLTHLQRMDRGRTREPFLYDDSWLRQKMTIAELDEHDWQIVLFPGVAAGLAQLSALLVPVLQRFWEDEVRKYNRSGGLLEDRLAQYLFGQDRTSLTAVSAELVELQSDRCFYCGKPCGDAAQVDHVIPWSRCGLDDLSNLVLTDSACNNDKSATLPIAELVLRAASRDGLQGISRRLSWDADPERTVRVGTSMIELAPTGLRLWSARSQYRELTDAVRDHEVRILRGFRANSAS